MTDAELHALIRDLGMHQRRKVVAALLAGNDAQCFTARQYAEAYHRICHSNDPVHKENWTVWLTEQAPMHLHSVGMVEVKPGVWAPEEGRE